MAAGEVELDDGAEVDELEGDGSQPGAQEERRVAVAQALAEAGEGGADVGEGGGGDGVFGRWGSSA